MSSLKKRLNDWPIQKKLIYSNLFGIAFAFVPIVFIMITYEYFSLRNNLVKEIRVHAEIVAESSAAAMAFRDKESAHETLFALGSAEDIIEAHLVLSDGSELEHYYNKEYLTNKSSKIFQASLTSKEYLTLSTITIEKPIYLRSEYVGSLVLISSMHNFYTRLAWYTLIISFATIIGFILARMVATRISKTITAPLMELMDATQKVTAGNDYSTPIQI